MKAFVPHIFYFLFLSLLHQAVAAQYKLRGTVLDSSRHYPLASVTVMSSAGKGTVTNENGQYQIDVGVKDSIWFSYLGKPTVKFPVLKIQDISQFDISLKVAIPILPEVRLRPRNYRLDSIQNRKDYAKVFDFRRPNLSTMTSIGPSGAGIDINELIRTFQFRRNRSTLKFQERLLLQEQEKYIDYRFNAQLVRRLTGLEGEELKTFMAFFRPDHDFVLYAPEYDFQLYIKSSFQKFKKTGRSF